MTTEKSYNEHTEEALNAVRTLVKYYSQFLKNGSGYTDDGNLIYLHKPEAEIALKFGMRSYHCGYHGSSKDMYEYVTINNVEHLHTLIEDKTMESYATIHCYLPYEIQTKMKTYIEEIKSINTNK